MTAVQAFVALGSNLGEPAARLDAARRALEDSPGIELVRVSSYLATAPVGGPPGQPAYLNAVAELETELAPRALLERLLEIERCEGRDRAREQRWGARRLDLDLLLFGDERLESAELTLPHPRMEERLFVLEPLAQLAPDRELAGCRRTVAQRVRDLRAEVREDGGRPPITCFETVREARAWCRREAEEGRSLGFVATMGALHEGHLGLVRRALAENDAVCVSVFVNPLQFDEARDLASYPRDFAADAALLEQAGAAMVFTGTLAQFFEGQLDARGELPREHLVDPGPCAVGLEGEFRKGHFEGVATIVDRLFEVVAPTRAYFGQKDYQQARVIADLARRRGGPEVVVCPTAREPSGLARSSRNSRLASDERQVAQRLSRALFATARAWQAGQREADALRAELRRVLEVGSGLGGGAGLEVEYAALRSLEEWSAEEPTGLLESAVALVAARVGEVRLIDNFVLSDPLPAPTGGESACR